MSTRFQHWLWTGLQGLLAPGRCAACDGPVAEPVGLFCGGCGLLLEPVPPNQRPPASTAALFLYGGPLAQALQRFKYGGRSELARGLAALLLEHASAYAGRVDRVIPLPLSSERLRARGYNQVALLARPLGRALGVSWDTRSLLRVRATAPQAGLCRAARMQNVRGAFRCRTRRADRVLLLDDVRTSGATLAEAAGTLLASGCVEVYTLALAFAQA